MNRLMQEQSNEQQYVYYTYTCQQTRNPTSQARSSHLINQSDARHRTNAKYYNDKRNLNLTAKHSTNKIHVACQSHKNIQHNDESVVHNGVAKETTKEEPQQSSQLRENDTKKSKQGGPKNELQYKTRQPIASGIEKVEATAKNHLETANIHKDKSNTGNSQNNKEHFLEHGRASTNKGTKRRSLYEHSMNKTQSQISYI
ncbi:unnamed protein product [Mytilus coruscus]|uniref:Uncharacterized protein n=1 Tax=Mytilus coruscus TaxID=42192 RepID=A0A6J8AIN5_MYTCO|nr:unnamed protein product [Mytilus coruscus]